MYNTGNPLGSTSPKDFSDNAEITDRYVNDVVNEATRDRFGRSRLTIHGQQEKARRSFEQFQSSAANVIANLGFFPPVDYTDGLNVDSRNFTVTYNDVVYAAQPSAVPFTTGAWDAAQWYPIQNLLYQKNLLVFDTYAEASAAAATLPDGQEIEAPDAQGKLSRYQVQSGVLVFQRLSEDAALTNYLPAGVGAVAKTVQEKLRELVSVKDFGAVGDGVTDDTEAIQAALDFAASSSSQIRRVFFPAGTYSTSTVYVPAGVVVEGEGISETTARTVAKLVQRTVGDVIRFIPQDTNGKLYWFGAIRRLAIFGDSALASGWGISLRNSAGATVSMQDLSCLEDLIIRRCPSGGIEIPNSGLPITLQRIKLLFNGGPGIHMTSVTSHQHQGVNFTDISGDGNDGGLIKLSGLDRSGSVNIFNLKSENRINSDYGSVGMQENAIVLDGCNGTPINIFGVTHICSIPDGGNYQKPGSVIKLLDANFPEINWSAVSVRVRVGDTGPDPSIVEYSTTVAIPYTTTSGRFGNSNFSHVTQASGYKQTFGPVSSYQADSAEDTALQIAGTAPGFSLYETDGAVDSKAWLMVASGGFLTLRAVKDDGTLGQIIYTVTRTALQVGPNASGTYLRINGTNTTSAAAGDASALPENPAGYITININGIDRRIPYYATA